jgi:hypothetical protein
MAIDPIHQAKSEQNLAWKRSWPSCFLRLIIILETLVGLVKINFVYLLYLIPNLQYLDYFPNGNLQYFNGFLAYKYFRWYLGINYNFYQLDTNRFYR